MFSQLHRDTNTNDNTTVTTVVTGRWWLTGAKAQQQVHAK
jgi:hypothetical protein